MGPWAPGPLAEGRLAWAAPGWIRGRLAADGCRWRSLRCLPAPPLAVAAVQGELVLGWLSSPRLVAPVQLGQPFRVPSWSEEPHVGRQCGGVSPATRHRSGFLPGALRHRTRVDGVQVGVREPKGEQQRLSEEEKEDGGEEQTEQHDKVTQAQPASVREHSDEEEHQKAADQGQSAPTMVTEARQESATAGVRPVPGPADISQSRAEQPKQPQLKNFPRTYQGDRRRCFSKDWYNTHKWLEYSQIIDVLLSEVKRRFSKENCAIMKGIQALNPCSPTFCEKDVVFPFASQYNCSTEDLQYEIPQLKRILERKQTSGQETPKSLIELTVFLEPYKEVFHQMFKLCKIALALPVSTASCERSFSMLKLIKTAMRSTMTDERLSNLGVLSVESRRARAINLDDFVDVFAKKHSNRRIKLF
ncbi:hypothetical protein N1851_027113 [Merluccius polli]|uniref:HAT C-terminal dimerisation domain-containing protein n=1 Tax=Merluccius polli TaxID=89951 RepID=A0AA47MAV0_MERPO|nr:hypothetical protein N1851_027113 [Merluccius polli]